MSQTPFETETPRALNGKLANGMDMPGNSFEAAATAHAELAAADDERTRLRGETDKVEFRVAMHDLAEGLRGMIRVAPFASVAAGVVLGMLLRRRRRPRPMRRRA